MGLLNARLVELLAADGIVAADAPWHERDVLGDWLLAQGVSVADAASVLNRYFTLPYLHVKETAHLQQVMLQCPDWPVYQLLDGSCVCLRPPSEVERCAYAADYGDMSLYISDAQRIRSLVLRGQAADSPHRTVTRCYVAEEMLRSEQGHVDGVIGRILVDAIDAEATDVHFYKMGDCFRVVFRLDGLLETYAELAPIMADGLINKLKLLAEMDVAEHRLPQDGHILLSYDGAAYNLRLGTLPLYDGEKIVLRILPEAQRRGSLEALDFTTAYAAKMSAFLTGGARGLVLITGPTNSGKTTTLYACLSQISAAGRLVYTIEDPIEAVLPEVQQMQVNARSGFSFAVGLRGILRSDPDVIAVGELRDAETVAIAARAALSGQLVLATLHAKNAQEAVDRLRDLGISDLLMSAVLSMVVNQRLLAQPCAACHGSGAREGVRCMRCSGNGRAGRTGVQEIWLLNEDERACIAAGESGRALRKRAMAQGFRTLAEDARAKGLAFYEEAS